MEKEIEIAMIAAANKAIKYQKENAHADMEKVIRHVMESVPYKNEVKIAAIASVSAVLKYKEKNPYATDREVLRFILEKIPELMEEIKLNED